MCGQLRELVMTRMLVPEPESMTAPEVYRKLTEIFSVMNPGGALQHLL